MGRWLLNAKTTGNRWETYACEMIHEKALDTQIRPAKRDARKEDTVTLKPIDAIANNVMPYQEFKANYKNVKSCVWLRGRCVRPKNANSI